MHVFDAALEDHQVRAALTGQLDTVAVIPFHDAMECLAALQNNRHRRPRLHLLDPVEILSVGNLGRSGLLARYRSGASAVVAVRGAGRQWFFHVGKTWAETTSIHH